MPGRVRLGVFVSPKEEGMILLGWAVAMFPDKYRIKLPAFKGGEVVFSPFSKGGIKGGLNLYIGFHKAARQPAKSIQLSF
jgi:hypothetical protein